VVLSRVIRSIAQNDRICFGAGGTVTALLFVTPGALASLSTAPLTGRLAAKIGFVTVLWAGLVFAVAVTSLLAVFTFDKGTVVVLMARVRIRAGSRVRSPGSTTPPTASAAHLDSPGPEQLSGRPRRTASGIGSHSPVAV
jgi:MFS family permease